MNLIPWRPKNELGSFRNELDGLFQRFFEDDAVSNLPATFRRGVSPPINVAESEKNWSVTLDLPGLDEKDIQVQLMGNQLVVSGERKWESEKKNKEFHRVEAQYGSFQRAILLPQNVRTDPDAVLATYKRGILEITIPKVEPTPTARIPIKGT